MKVFIDLLAFGVVGGVLGHLGILFNTAWEFYAIVGAVVVVQINNSVNA